ncbi:MAG: regulatory protein RecX [Flavobacteriales bacterium]
MSSAKKIYTRHQALLKAQKYCAYQERCQQDVRNDLYKLGVQRDDIEGIISDLISSNFLNEERYSRAFARGKFKNNDWGWIKIEMELKQRNISSYCINKAKTEIDEDSYKETIVDLAKKKLKELKGETPYIQKGKIIRFIVGKGFESEKVIDAVEGLL